jgi:DNA topoisomerase-3
MFQKLVMEDGILEVNEISEKQESKSRPSGLNTVNLLKVRKICRLTLSFVMI